MKAKYIPHFREWLDIVLSLDSRLDVTDLNKLFRLYRESYKCMIKK